MDKLTTNQSFLLGVLITTAAVGSFRSEIMKPRHIEVNIPQVIVNQPDSRPDFIAEAKEINSSLNQSKLAHLLMYIHSLSEHYDVEYDLVKAVITTESSWDHRAISSSNARGLMQMLPRYSIHHLISCMIHM